MLIEALPMLGERERTMLWICILLQWVHEVDRLHAPVFFCSMKTMRLFSILTEENDSFIIR